jgi:radical SAM superfamily enzyme YgiQ (UPF0313 family)
MKVLRLPAKPDTFWSFKHVLPFVAKRAAFPPLGLLTVAAMLGRLGTSRRHEHRAACRPDIAGPTGCSSGMIVHKFRATSRGVASWPASHRRWPLFTTGHRTSEIRHFVLGEAENVIDDSSPHSAAVSDRAADFPDVQDARSALDLADLRHYVTMPVQFSRGCPFDCEFCDIVAMYGRVPRARRRSR